MNSLHQHKRVSFADELRSLLIEAGVEFDEKYLLRWANGLGDPSRVSGCLFVDLHGLAPVATVGQSLWDSRKILFGSDRRPCRVIASGAKQSPVLGDCRWDGHLARHAESAGETPVAPITPRNDMVVGRPHGRHFFPNAITG